MSTNHHFRSGIAPANRHWVLLVMLLGAVLGFVGRAQTLSDAFADRDSDNNEAGSARANNASATLEPREPRHGGKPGGHSMWIQWTAPATGIATVSTDGSDFDTLLSVYVIDPSNPEKPVMDRLRTIALNDDAPDAKTSLVQFGAIAGTVYQIAVDGYAGASGDIRLRWDLVRSDVPLPTIVQVPPDRALKAGDPLTLTVDILDGRDVKLAWFFNETELAGTDSNVLTIPSFQRENVGRYRLRITADKVRFFSDPIEIQINSEGEINTLARDKLFDAGDSALVGHDNGEDNGGNGAVASPAGRRGARPAGPIGDSRGFNGTQIFNTTYAQADPGEPSHCGIKPNASYWLSYIAPVDGQLTIDTEGSDFDTVLEVYGLNGPLTGYASLVSLGCDNDSGTNGKTSRVRVPVELGKTYYIVVDGVAGVRGIAHLNYQLPKPTVAVAPSISTQPVSTGAVAGTAVSFTAAAAGTAPFTFSWLHDGTPVPNGTNALLEISSPQPADTGSYWVIVSNAVGHATSQPATLTVFVPPAFRSHPVAQRWISGSNVELRVEVDGHPAPAIQWFKNNHPLPDATNAVLRIVGTTLNDAGTYRVEITNVAGTAASEPAEIEVVVPPSIVASPASRTVAAGTDVNLAFAIDGTAPLTVVWFKDEILLPDASGPVLALAAVQVSHSGRYRIEVANAAGKASSAVVELLVLQAPRVRVQPTSQLVPAGGDALLAVDIEGSEPLEFVWRHRDAVIDGATSRNLALPGVGPTDAGAYVLEVRNPVGRATSDAAVLDVLVGATWRRDPATGSLELTAPAPDGQAFSIESIAALGSGEWLESHRGTADAGGVHVVQPIVDGASQFFRVRLH